MTHKLAAPTPPLQTAVTEYLDWHALRGSSLRHRGDIRRMLLAFAAAVDPERPLDLVDRDDCTVFLRGVQERGGKPNTLKAYHRVLDAFFNWLDAPIPNATLALKAPSAESRFQASTAETATAPSTINLVGPVALPDPTGMQGVLAAIQNGNMFRDMSKAAELAGMISSLANVSGQMGQAATKLTGDVADVLATVADAWTGVGADVPHVVTHLTLSVGSPSTRAGYSDAA